MLYSKVEINLRKTNIKKKKNMYHAIHKKAEVTTFLSDKISFNTTKNVTRIG